MQHVDIELSTARFILVLDGEEVSACASLPQLLKLVEVMLYI